MVMERKRKSQSGYFDIQRENAPRSALLSRSTGSALCPPHFDRQPLCASLDVPTTSLLYIQTLSRSFAPDSPCSRQSHSISLADETKQNKKSHGSHGMLHHQPALLGIHVAHASHSPQTKLGFLRGGRYATPTRRTCPTTSTRRQKTRDGNRRRAQTRRC